MFEKIGAKLVRGAKAEMLETPKGIDLDRILQIAAGIAEGGLFLLAIALDRKPRASQPTTVIVNNYISKEERNHE